MQYSSLMQVSKPDLGEGRREGGGKEEAQLSIHYSSVLHTSASLIHSPLAHFSLVSVLVAA